MSSLPWDNLNPHIKKIPATKKFYNRFTNKLTYYVLGIYILPICKTPDSIDLHVFKRSSAKGLDIVALKKFSELYLVREDKYKYRCEGDSVSIFADKEEDLYDLASGPLLDFTTNLRSITSIQNEQDREIIQSGSIIMRKNIGFQFKVTIRDGFKYAQDRLHLAQYLSSIRSEIKISDFLLRTMLGKYKYIHSCYFYVNDPKIVDMIALVAPTLVKRIQKVVVR